VSLDLSSFEAALNELDVFLGLCVPDAPVFPQSRAFQAASIQAFEFTYELCHRMLRRYLADFLPSAAPATDMSFPDLIRTGYGSGIVRSEWKTWSRFREMRNITSHTYDPRQAALVLDALPAFSVEARHLLNAMRARSAP
jgi:nucleotidyltransferase substrate binding protein (TIGR01987 family)